MPRVPFPQILTFPKFTNSHLLRFVDVAAISVNELLMEHDHVQENLNTREFEPVYNCYLISEIYEQRPARGDWSAYEVWPTYYSCKGEYVGQFFKSAIPEEKAKFLQTSLTL